MKQTTHRLLCLGPTPGELRAWQPALPVPWQFLRVCQAPDLLPWETQQREAQDLVELHWGGLAQSADNQIYLFQLLQQIQWQAIWITQPEYAFLGVFAARLLGKPAFVQWPANSESPVFSPAESTWLLENAQVVKVSLETDLHFHKPFPIAPHLGIVYTKFVSETDI